MFDYCFGQKKNHLEVHVCVYKCACVFGTSIIFIVNQLVIIIMYVYIWYFIHAEGVAIDGDNPDHIVWIFEKAQERADEYGIQGVNYRLTQGEYIPQY